VIHMACKRLDFHQEAAPLILCSVDNPTSFAHLSFDIADNMSPLGALIAYTEQSYWNILAL